MDNELAERLYQAADESLRASLKAWATAFDAARAAGSDPMRWAVEDATWQANRRAVTVRSVAWDVADSALAESRDRERASAIGRQPASIPSDAPEGLTPTPSSPQGG